MGLLEEVFVKLHTEGDKDIARINDAIKTFGLNLRLAGRDLMRMGGSLQNCGAFLMSFGMSAFKSSDIIQDAMGDIEIAFVDAFEAAGILDWVADVLEKIAEVLEAVPGLAWGAFILLLIGYFVTWIGKIFTVLGFINLFVGSALSARKVGDSWTSSIRQGIKALMGLNDELVKTITLQILAQEQLKKTGNSMILDREQAEKFSKEIAEKSGIVTKSAKKEKKGMMGVASAGLLAAGAIGGMLFVMFALGPLMEALEPIFSALGDAFESFFEGMEPAIEAIAEWIEQNQTLAVSLILAAVLLPIIISYGSKLTGIIGKLTGKTGALGDVLGETGTSGKEAGGGLSKTIIALAILLPEVVLLIYALKDFIKTAGEVGLSWSEIGLIIGVLVANIGAIFAVLVVTIQVLQGVKEISYSVIGAFVVLGGVAIALITAFAYFVQVASQTGFTAVELAILLTALAANVDVLMLVIAAATTFLANLNNVNLNAIAYVITLAGVVISLVLAFAYFLQVASETGFKVSEISSLITTLTAALIIFLAALVIAVIVLASLSVTAAMAMPVVALLLGIGAAAVLIGLGFLLAGLGIKFACEGLALLVNYIPQLAVLIPILLGITAGFFTLGIAAGVFALVGMLAGLALFFMAAGVLALAAAFMLLAEALSRIPDWAQGFVGGMASLFGKLFGAIPGLEAGGIVTEPGLAYLHPEEAVTPAGVTPLPGKGGYKPKEPPLTVSVDVTGAKSVEDIIKRSVEASVAQLSAQMEKRYRRKEY